MGCQRRKPRLRELFMANLPEIRVTQQQPPFTSVRVGFFGPLQMKRGRSKVKRYGGGSYRDSTLFDTDSMITAFRRFISIRGSPKKIKNDRETNFVSANKAQRQ